MLLKINQINPKSIIQTKKFKKTKIILQTHSIKIKNSIPCTNSEKIELKLKELFYENVNEITIFSLSTINVTNRIILLLKALSLKGVTIYLVSYEDKKLSYADIKE
ncbi:hypothetical protein DMUE_1125 [Dictyocoela muelleri]|nr:hypothetical protein DMUE_1125 [Dictyocoela muelleri]